MILKTLLAIFVTASLAAGAVYYGSMSNGIKNNTASELTHNSTVDASSPTTQTSIQKLLKRIDGNKRVQEKPSKTVKTHNSKNTKPTPKADPVIAFDILMSQAERIEEITLQDQAYVDIVHYALRSNLFDEAQEAMLKIRQPELRDTSRGQMGIAIGRLGYHKKAFSIIDQVETDGLRDVLRLQVIEAVAAP